MEASRTPLSEAEFEEIMNRNRAISSSAISRAVSDASAGNVHIYAPKCLLVVPFFPPVPVFIYVSSSRLWQRHRDPGDGHQLDKAVQSVGRRSLQGAHQFPAGLPPRHRVQELRLGFQVPFQLLLITTLLEGIYY